MNTKQLWQALANNTTTDGYFDGIFPIDRLKYIKHKPKLIICNTDPSNKPGEHWILFFFDESNSVDFFDSLGQSISSYGNEFINFAKKFANKYVWTKERVQPIGSSLCGHYCLFYAMKRCEGLSMESIIPLMRDANDVINFVNTNYKIYPSQSSLFQCCTDQ